MATLTVLPITKAGLNLTTSLVAADVAGDSVPVSSGLMFYAKTTNAASSTITVTPPVSTTDCGNFGDLDVDPLVFTLAANTGEQAFTIPLGYANSGVINLVYSAVTDVTVGVFSLA